MIDKKIIPYIIASVILLIVVIAAVFLFHMPMAGKILVKQQEYKQKSDQLNLVRQKVKELAKLRGEIEKMQEETAILQSQIPNSADIPGVVKLMEKFAEESNVIIVKLQFQGGSTPSAAPAGGTSDSPILTSVCQMSLKGNYGSVVQFFEALKSSPRLFGIKNINFSPTGEDGKEVNINLDLAFFNYNTPPAN